MTLRFVADAMLGTLAKWLRILGYDTHYDPALDDHQLVRLARAETRVLLTRDRELSKRRGLQVLLVASEKVEEQVAQVVADLELNPGKEFSRCPDCSAPLQMLEPGAAEGRVPPYVAQTHKRFKLCPACQKVYWRGTHWRNMDRTLSRMRTVGASASAGDDETHQQYGG
ncbi:Mut7-C RNAse domain-containing protein [Chloroflexota bacterium]